MDLSLVETKELVTALESRFASFVFVGHRIDNDGLDTYHRIVRGVTHWRLYLPLAATLEVMRKNYNDGAIVESDLDLGEEV